MNMRVAQIFTMWTTDTNVINVKTKKILQKCRNCFINNKKSISLQFDWKFLYLTLLTFVHIFNELFVPWSRIIPGSASAGCSLLMTFADFATLQTISNLRRWSSLTNCRTLDLSNFATRNYKLGHKHENFKKTTGTRHETRQRHFDSKSKKSKTFLNLRYLTVFWHKRSHGKPVFQMKNKRALTRLPITMTIFWN